MTLQSFRVLAAALLLALLGAACSSSASVTPTTTDTGQTQSTQTQAGETQAGETQGGETQTGQSTDAATSGEAPAPAASSAALATSPLDYATISAGVTYTETPAIPCQLAGPAVAAFAEGRGLELQQITGNACEWREGFTDAVTVHFREVDEIDVAERRRLHGSDDTVVDESGPGTQAASYLDANGLTERYFFVSGSRAVFLVAETNPPVSLGELRTMADEVAGMIGSAVDEGQLWQSAGDASEDALCQVWDQDTIGALFAATAVFETSSTGCNWFMESPNNQVHEVTISIDQFDSVEIFTRNGGSDAGIGDRSATITEDGIFGTSQQTAFAQGDAAILITVDSPTNSGAVDMLARNIAARLNENS